MGKGTIGGKGGGRVGDVGLGGAPTQHEQVHREHVSSRAHDTTPPDRPVQYTLRLSEEEAERLDASTRRLRRAVGRRSVSASEVLRALVERLDQDEELTAWVTAQLRETPSRP